MRTRHHVLLTCAALTAFLGVTARGANAQGKAHGKERQTASEKRVVVVRPEERRRDEHGGARVERVERVERVRVEPAKPAHVKKVKVVTTDDAIVVTREVLVKHGYEVVRVERVRGARVVYYRRGNMGRGRGKGPIVRMIIRPAQERVVFESAPRGLVAEINVRLGM
jgi:hypothetical protein